MGRRTRRYETEFHACLLTLGPPPVNESVFGNDLYITALDGYKQDVREWWFTWHNNNTPPGSKSQNKFCKRYMRWVWIRLRKLTTVVKEKNSD